MQDPNAPDEGWWFGWARMLFNVPTANPYIVAPREVARLIVMDVCKQPTRIKNGFYEFLDFGIGLQPTGCNTRTCQTLQTYERETVSTLADLEDTPQYIRVYPTDSRDLGKSLLVQGKDNNGITVISTDVESQSDILGEDVTVDIPFATSARQFSSITGFVKDMSYGPWTIMQVDPVTGAELPLSVMQPSETTANYRKYFINGLPSRCCNTVTGQVQVYAQARLDFIPVRSDPDYLPIPSIPALIEEGMSIRKGRMDSIEAQKMADRHHERALSILFGQTDLYNGKQNVAINVPLFGSDRVMTTFQ